MVEERRERELKRKIEEVENTIRKKDLVSKAREVVALHGNKLIIEGNPEQTDRFLWNNLSINYTTGSYSSGRSEKLNIIYIGSQYQEEARVFCADTKISDPSMAKFTPFINGFYIHAYHPGEWEEDLKLIFKLGHKGKFPLGKITTVEAMLGEPKERIPKTIKNIQDELNPIIDPVKFRNILSRYKL